MAITTSSVFDIVVLLPRRGSGTYVAILNGATYVAGLQFDFATGSHNTTTDEFQIVLAAIQDGSAYERYDFGDGNSYTDATLPSWLSWGRDQNPFHLAAQANDSEAETEPYNELWFKIAPALEGLTLTFPSFDHTSTTAAYAAFEADGWQRPIPTATPSDTEALYEMRLLRTREPVFTEANPPVLLRYDLRFVGIDITTRTRKYSADKLNWHTDPVPGDIWYAEILPNGQWQENLLEPEVTVIPAGTTKEIEKVSTFGHYSPGVIRYLLAADVSLSKLKEVIIRAFYFTSWDQLVIPVAANVIRFPPKMVQLITPAELQSMVDARTYNAGWGWLSQIKKDGTGINQGVTTGTEPDRDNYNCCVVSLVSNPVLRAVYDSTDHTRVFVDNTDGLATNDLLYWGDEVLRVTDVEVVVGEGYIEIHVERAINGSTMLPTAEELTTPIYGIVKGKQFRYVALSRMETTPYPSRFYLGLKLEG